jgi:hypothetical protein
MKCVTATFPYYLPPALSTDVTSQAILDLHEEARFQLVWQYRKHLLARLRAAKIDGSPSTVDALAEDIQKLENEYDWLAHPFFDPASLVTAHP